MQQYRTIKIIYSDAPGLS